MALRYSGSEVELREVLLQNKPQSLLACSQKGTVPVLVLDNGRVIDESFEIMLWALSMNDPDGWLPKSNQTLLSDNRQLISENDDEFKGYLDRYKYADRYPQETAVFYRSQAEVFLATLNKRLEKTRFLLSDQMMLADVALFPFIRQFAFVDKQWFWASDYVALQNWLEVFLKCDLFVSVMHKYKPWVEGDSNLSAL